MANLPLWAAEIDNRGEPLRGPGPRGRRDAGTLEQSRVMMHALMHS